MIFTIDTDNNITAHDSLDSVAADAERFNSAKELAKLAADWPAERLVEIWNSLAGVKPVKKFTSRKTATDRIWKAIQSLGATRAPAAPTKRAKAKQSAPESREGSKKEAVLKLLRQKNGANLAAIMEATGWQAHSVRGFISGALIKKAGLAVESFKRDSGERAYRIAGRILRQPLVIELAAVHPFLLVSIAVHRSRSATAP